MDKQPLIKQGWLRGLIFLIVFYSASIALAIVAGLLVGIWKGPSAVTDSSIVMLISFIVSFIAAMLTVWVFRKFIDRKTLFSLGFSTAKSGSHAGVGFFLSLLILCCGTLILVAMGQLGWSDIVFDGNSLFISLGFIVLASFAEELVFRGYLLNNLMQSMDRRLALLLSATAFSLFHFTNPSITSIALLNIFIAGLLLGLNYIYTKNLWFGILLHIGWNFMQGPILGYKVSGLPFQSLLQQQLTGDDIITGGAFGFEGSVINSVLTVLTILILFVVYEKKFNAVKTGDES